MSGPGGNPFAFHDQAPDPYPDAGPYPSGSGPSPGPFRPQTGPIGRPESGPSTHGPSGPLARPRRGQRLAWVSLVLAVVVAVVVALGVFGTLDAVDVVSVDPLGPAIGWIVLAGAGVVASLVLIVVTLVAVFWCRPRLVAATALVAAVVLPLVAVTAAATMGWSVLKLHVAQDVAAVGGPVAAASVRDVLDALGVTGPLRDLLDRWAA